MVYSSSVNTSGFEKGRMVFFEGGKRFEVEDLLRASAEMLGKGAFGTAYKAVLDDGSVVAVKRLKDVQIGGKREFEQQMEVIGRLRHTNVVSLRAYYFARDEKLLVSDYIPNASLFWLLHGMSLYLFFIFLLMWFSSVSEFCFFCCFFLFLFCLNNRVLLFSCFLISISQFSGLFINIFLSTKPNADKQNSKYPIESVT